MSADNRLTLCVATSFEDFSGAVVALATDGSILFANKQRLNSSRSSVRF